MQHAVRIVCLFVVLAVSPLAHAQDEGAIAPLPSNAMDAIMSNASDDAAMLTTHEAKPEKSQPFKTMDGANKSTFTETSGNAAPTGQYSPKVPFGKAEPAAPIIPSGPHETVAVPVVDVDALDAPEAAPPAPVEAGADPVQENPAEPTELTSPIFEAEVGPMGTRSVVIRALNKVTAQSETITLKSNQMVKFGQLQITAITCQTSAARSQTDYAALLDIVEKLPTGDGTKPVFRGWMYASSPSIAALEHPVYDVTMVECKSMPHAGKDAKPEQIKESKAVEAKAIKDPKEAPKASGKTTETKEKNPATTPKQ